jgi:Fur family ferric uptake transcriptional regulator
VPADVVPPVPSDAALRERVRAAGLRVTSARLAVLRVLHLAGLPASHPEVCTALQTDGWDRATLYRNLCDLTEAGLLRRVDLGDRVWRFELLSAPTDVGHDAAHPHFLCTSCGDVTCLPDLTVAGAVPSARPVAVQLRGECVRCAS